MKIILILILIFTFRNLPAQVSSHTDHDTLSVSFESYIQQRMQTGRIPGMSMALIHPDGTTEFLNFGFADLSETELVNEHTLFEIGSVTKTVTAGLLYVLLDSSEFSVDSEVDRVTGNLRLFPESGMTLHHLLTHHSGLPRLPGNMAPADPADPYRKYTNGMMYNFLENAEPEPGIHFEYSNLGYMLLGSILEILSGSAYDDLIKRYLQHHFGMTSTSRTIADSSRFAVPSSGGLAVQEWNFDGVKGMGDLRSTTADMAAYLKIMTGRDDTGTAAAFRNTAEQRISLNDNMFAAHGWFVKTNHNDEIIFHDGGTGGFRSFAGYSTETGKGAVILTNSDHEIQDIGFHLLNPGYALREIPEYAELDSSQLKLLEGTYRSDILPDFTVFRNGNRLFGQMEGQQALLLHARSTTEFENETVQAVIVFDIEEENTAASLMLKQAGQEFHFRRL